MKFFLYLLLFPTCSYAVCDTYPCADYGHVLTGAVVGYAVTKLVGPKTAFVTVGALAVSRELYDKTHGKSFRGRDVLTRMVGGGLGIYIAKEW
jgi:hypothetical protein